MPDRSDHDLPGNIGAPCTRALIAAGYTSMSDLDGVSRVRLLALHGVGPTGLDRLQAALAGQGRSLAE